MGAGDWNDGMNRVGIEGKGESVWLGWFLYACLTRFAPLCASMDDAPRGEQYLLQAEALRAALEASAWDGAWYRRAWYDDGTPLGSARSQECRIDAIAQSWAALSGAGEPARVRRAMESVSERLVRPGDRLVLLFTPPFDGGRHDPGYIKGYPPGIRENGGQYTHAALWTAWAFAELGQVERAEGLFRLLNPIHHSDTQPKARRYRLEPYVVAADVYSAAPHTGRGGWNWYTGSGGWMYRLGLEAILGVRRSGDALRIEPCLPPGWRGCEVSYRFGAALYRIEMSIAGAGGGRRVRRITLDGRPLRRRQIPLYDDGEEHRVQVLLG
jgi:cellobiose phosphorylase